MTDCEHWSDRKSLIEKEILYEKVATTEQDYNKWERSCARLQSFHKGHQHSHAEHPHSEVDRTGWKRGVATGFTAGEAAELAVQLRMRRSI